MKKANASLVPNLGYRDARAAMRFLVEAFGFEEVVVYDGDHVGDVGHAELRWPDGGVVTLHTAEDRGNSVANLAAFAVADGGYPAYSIHVNTNEPEKVFARAVAAGATVVRKLREGPYGRGFIVKDPEGLYWSFGTPLPKLVRDRDGKWKPATRRQKSAARGRPSPPRAAKRKRR